MLSIKERGIKYHFLSLWYDLTLDWNPVSWITTEHSVFFIILYSWESIRAPTRLGTFKPSKLSLVTSNSWLSFYGLFLWKKSDLQKCLIILISSCETCTCWAANSRALSNVYPIPVFFIILYSQETRSCTFKQSKLSMVTLNSWLGSFMVCCYGRRVICSSVWLSWYPLVRRAHAGLPIQELCQMCIWWSMGSSPQCRIG